MRTNIDLDEELMNRVMKLYRLPSKRAAVDFALRRLVERKEQAAILKMEGSGWEGDLEAMRQWDVVESSD